MAIRYGYVNYNIFSVTAIKCIIYVRITMERNKTIDVMKGMCILCVVLTHYTWTQIERNKFLFPFWVDMAVPVFMILSGYVYAKSFANKKISSFEDAYESRRIIVKVERFLVPFTMMYILELCSNIVLKDSHYSFRQIYNGFLCGGFVFH